MFQTFSISIQLSLQMESFMRVATGPDLLRLLEMRGHQIWGGSHINTEAANTTYRDLALIYVSADTSTVPLTINNNGEGTHPGLGPLLRIITE